ncbi:group 3 secretory phospholipase A2 [Gadus chalcogrammus]|uniref:group 3 secretory phospholipase A2 n=1 Tax=Gadus chalcogrammus TaxID=1042646 RepID=UPI0024C488A3|nr:group 3 secretory phospholipase A2 [Gadus chalcogrammus]
MHPFHIFRVFLIFRALISSSAADVESICAYTRLASNGETHYSFLRTGHHSPHHRSAAVRLYHSVWSPDRALLQCSWVEDAAVTENYLSLCREKTNEFLENHSEHLNINALFASNRLCDDVNAPFVVKERASRSRKARSVGALSERSKAASHRRVKRGFIVPGTLWCGSGNKALSYADLGTFTGTDSCCREHDHCQETILSFQNKFGVFNTNIFTMSHCDCDNRFHSCLRNANDSISDVVGKVFFNMLQMNCFELSYTVICMERNWFGMCKVTQTVLQAEVHPPVAYEPHASTSQETATQENDAQENDAQENATQENATQENATQENDDQENATLENATLENATLENATQENATLENATLENATQENATLANATLENATLENATLENATQENATLENATLENATLENATLENATQENATLENATLENATQQNATQQNATQQNATQENGTQEKAILETVTQENATQATPTTSSTPRADPPAMTSDLTSASAAGPALSVGVWATQMESSVSPSPGQELSCEAYRELDQCSRARILPKQRRYGLLNPDTRTLYHCSCTKRLFQILAHQRRLTDVDKFLLDRISQSCFLIPDCGAGKICKAIVHRPALPTLDRTIPGGEMDDWRHLQAVSLRVRTYRVKRKNGKAVRLSTLCDRIIRAKVPKTRSDSTH